jgi:glycosyltransferase involved in cell wall biosynthesis
MSDQQSPKVSVIMPAYNSARFIGRSIAAVLKQDLLDLELLVIDDGSTDETLAVVKGYEDKRIRSFTKANGGAASARNRGLREARGEYVAYCDADDVFFPDHLSSLAEYLDSHPEVGLAYTRAQILGPQDEKRAELGKPYDYKKLQIECLIVPSLALHRRACSAAIGPWDENLNSNEDWDFFLRIADNYPVVFIDKITLSWVRTGGLLAKSLQTGTMFTDYSYLLLKRLAFFQQRAQAAGRIAPFAGYYFYHLRNLERNIQMGKNARFYDDAKPIYAAKILPTFDQLALLDRDNLEVWLASALVCYKAGRTAPLLTIGRSAARLLDQRLSVQVAEEDNLMVELMGKLCHLIAGELAAAGEKNLAERYYAKGRELNVR